MSPILLSSKNKESIDNKKVSSSHIVSKMNGFAGKVSLILGLTVASNMALPSSLSPHIPTYKQEISTSTSAVNKRLTEIVIPAKTIVQTQESVNPAKQLSTQPKLRMAVAKKGDSVESFMLQNFGTKIGWELLVEKGTGNRIRVPAKDLIAGKTYVLARDTNEANTLANVFKKQITKQTIKNELPVNHKIETSIMKPPSPSLMEGVFKKAEEIGLDFNKYIHSISSVESGHRYGIDNTHQGEKMKVDASKWAFGKYQFTNETLNSYGISTPEQRLSFLKNPKQQENIMRRYTLDHMKYMMKKPVFISLIESGVPPNKILSAMHHMGAGWTLRIAEKSIISHDPATTFLKKLKWSRDWMNASTYAYVTATALKYDTIISEVKESHKVTKLNTVSTEISTYEKQPKVVMASVAKELIQKDYSITEKDSLSREDNKGTTIAAKAFVDTEIQKVNREASVSSKIIPVAHVQNVAQLLTQEHRSQVIQKLQDSTTIQEDVRKSVLAKLEKVTDFSAYYKQNIAHYEAESRNGSLYAKRILPGLYKLLWDIESKTTITASNDANISLKRAA